MKRKNKEVCDSHVELDECPYCVIEELQAEVERLIDSGFEHPTEKNSLKTENNRLQLVVGRYQFLHEAAQTCINSIDDHFEYVFKSRTPEQLQVTVRGHLAKYAEALSVLNK